MSAFAAAAIEVIRSVPPGDVMTYGEVAEEAGHPGAARAVGRLLRTCDVELPWWRVVGAGGRLVSPSSGDQARRLHDEGWTVNAGRLLPPTNSESGE